MYLNESISTALALTHSPPEQNGRDFAFENASSFSSGSNEHYSSIGSNDVSVPARRQAIIWTNAG